MAFFRAAKFLKFGILESVYYFRIVNLSVSDMKKSYIQLFVAIPAMLFTSCDANYDLGKLDNSISISVKVDDAQPEKPVTDLLDVPTETNEDGGLTVVGEGVTSTPSCPMDDFKSSTEPVSLPEADADIPLPFGGDSKFPDDNIYSALVDPAIVISGQNGTGTAFELAGNLVSENGTKFPFMAEIPAEGDFKVYLSETGSAGSSDSNIIKVAVKDFTKLFEGSPDSIAIKDVTVKAITTKASSITSGGEAEFTFQYSCEFPLVIKKGQPVTVRESIDLREVDFTDNIGIKKVTVYATVNHNLPFSFEPTLISPTDITAKCSRIMAASYPAYTEQEIEVEGECPSGLKSGYEEAVVDLLLIYEGPEDSVAIKEDMTLQLTITKYTVTN